MNLEEKLRQLKKAAEKSARDAELERQLEHLRRVGARHGVSRIGLHDDEGGKVAAALDGRVPLPAHRAAQGIEAYVDGKVERNDCGEFFLTRQALPFGRPYGKLRIGDFSTADLNSLSLFLGNTALPEPSRLMFLDTETTGLDGGTGTCAFLIGIGAVEGSQFVVRQFFLRDYPEEKAMLAALADVLESYQGLVTFNGKTFDVPLLETRYALARLGSPLARLVHLDLLHPARRMWKLRLESCALKNLENELLGIRRQGDVDGSEIPGIYFDYLRTGDARGLQPVFYHNALDIISLAALTVEMAGVIATHSATGSNEAHAAAPAAIPSLDLFSLSRIFERSGSEELSLSICRRALEAGLPETIETQALWQLAAQYKRRREHELAVKLWLEVARRKTPFALRAFEELAIYYEHRVRDAKQAFAFAEKALEFLRSSEAGMESSHTPASRDFERFSHRLARLRRKMEQGQASLMPKNSGTAEHTEPVDMYLRSS